jgi:hypothetical protein
MFAIATPLVASAPDGISLVIGGPRDPPVGTTTGRAQAAHGRPAIAGSLTGIDIVPVCGSFGANPGAATILRTSGKISIANARISGVLI